METFSVGTLFTRCTVDVEFRFKVNAAAGNVIVPFLFIQAWIPFSSDGKCIAPLEETLKFQWLILFRLFCVSVECL